MQRVSALLPSWDKARAAAPDRASITGYPNANGSGNGSGNGGGNGGGSGSGGLSKVFGWGANKRASTSTARLSITQPSPTNAVSTRASKEAFWPSSLDKECDKAARILKSFCSEGFLASESDSGASSTVPTTPKRVPKRIPASVIQNAVALAVFTTMRSGLWITGSGGSGILIARKADGTWSPPSALLLHTPILSFVIGTDVYDCVLVINDFSVLEIFTRPSLVLGTDVNVSTGPLVAADETNGVINCKDLDNSVFSYLKSRGVYAEIHLDGSVLTERSNENEKFYESTVSVLDVLAGNVRRDVPELRPLTEMLKAAEGRTDYDAELVAKLSNEASPGDMTIESARNTPISPRPSFGIPDVDDPDPYGVLALEMAGLEIREAGSQLRPVSTQFEYNPTPASPIFAQFHRQSMDTFLSRSNRGSYMSNRTLATERTQMTDAYTQTDIAETPDTTPSPSQSDNDKNSIRSDRIKEEEEDYTKIDTTPIRHLGYGTSVDEETQITSTETDDIHSQEPLTPATQASSTCVEEDEDEDADDEENEDGEEEPVVFEVATAAPPQRAVISNVAHVFQAKGALVNIPKRVPPPLPIRSPARLSRNSRSSFGDLNAISGLSSPLRHEFLETEAPIDDGTSSNYDAKSTDGLDENVREVEVEVEAETEETDVKNTEVETQPEINVDLTGPAKADEINTDPFRISHKPSISVHTTAGTIDEISSPVESAAFQQGTLIQDVPQNAAIACSQDGSAEDKIQNPGHTTTVVPQIIGEKATKLANDVNEDENKQEITIA